MRSREALLIHQILEAVRQIEIYFDDVDRTDFLQNQLLQDAVALRFIQIGEAAARLVEADVTIPSRYTAVPWAEMRGLRNRLVHAYGSIDQEAVWDTAKLFLPDLKSALSQLPIE